MRVEVWDDKFSIGHTILGAIAYFLPVVWAIFLAYEVIEFAYKRRRRKEPPANFIGDLLEFAFGMAAAHAAVLAGIGG